MIVVVAIQTLPLGEVGPLVLSLLGIFVFNVALRAFELVVLSFQFKLSVSRVIETNICLETLQAVAGIAVLVRKFSAEEVNVILFMAAHTGGCLSDIASGFRIRLPLFNMALAALDIFMLPLERVASLGVIKGGRINLRRIKGPTFVISVALDTACAGEPMKASPRSDIFCYFSMALKTFGVGNALAGIMALETIFALKLFMSFDQWTGGEEAIENSFVLSQRQ